MAAHPTQAEEEDRVRAFFDAATDGFFVEIGVGHPTAGSQTWHLEQAGWTGILVEPQPELAAFLVTGRKARVFAVACTDPDNAGQTLSLYVDAQAGRGRVAPGSEQGYTVLVPTRTLDELLDEAEAPEPFDLLSLHVGGREIEVLSGFDFARWEPALILLNGRAGGLKAHRLLALQGYRLIRRAGDNGWYVPADSPVQPTAAERWGSLCGFYLGLPFRMLSGGLRRVARFYADWWHGR